MLVTLGGAVGRPGITELESGTPLRDALERCDGLRPSRRRRCSSAATSAPGCRPRPRSTRRSRTPACDRSAPRSARARSPSLPQPRCGVAETARIAATWPRESAGQCGPCVFGLARDRRRARARSPPATRARRALEARCGALAPQVTGRGACAHPNGADAARRERARGVRRRDRATTSPAPARRARPSRCCRSRRPRRSGDEPPATHLRVNPIRCDALRPLRRAAARADLARRVGLPDHRRRARAAPAASARRAAPSRYARGSRSCSSSATPTASELGLVVADDDRRPERDASRALPRRPRWRRSPSRRAPRPPGARSPARGRSRACRARSSAR